MTHPNPIDITPEKFEALKERIRTGNIDKNDNKLIEVILENYSYLMHVIENKELSIKKLQKLYFGSNTESLNNLKDSKKAEKKLENKDKQLKKIKDLKKKNNNKPKGHGRNGSEVYKGAERISVSLDKMNPGDICPSCRIGKVYPVKDPVCFVRLTGSAPLSAKVYELVVKNLKQNLQKE